MLKSAYLPIFLLLALSVCVKGGKGKNEAGNSCLLVHNFLSPIYDPKTYSKVAINALLCFRLEQILKIKFFPSGNLAKDKTSWG